jgi:sec-independent protein translocase protein TatA
VPNLGTPELLIIAILLLVLFGAKRLPDSARSLGRSLRIFKAETRGLRDDDDTTITPSGLKAGESTTPAPGSPETLPPTPPAEQQRPAQQ